MNENNNLIIDTNILIYYFEGKISLNPIFKIAIFIWISIVSFLGFLAFEKLRLYVSSKFNSFVKLIKGIDTPIFETQVDFFNLGIRNKRKHIIKLPECIIVGQAISNHYILISNDNQLNKVKNFKSTTL